MVESKAIMSQAKGMSVDDSGVNAEAALEIVEITPELKERAVTVLLEAFKAEEITSYQIDMGRPSSLRRAGILDGIFLQLYLESGRPLLAALDNGQLAGVGVIRDPRIPISKRRATSLFIPNLPQIAALYAPRLVRSLRLLAATRPPKGLIKPYFTFEALGVHPDHQGKGVGMALMRKAQARVNENPEISGIYLITGSEKNQGFYESLGYDTLRINELGPVKAYHMFWQSPAFDTA